MKYYYIDEAGGVVETEYNDDTFDKMLLDLGNHFETEEEARSAVEKLRVLKRLRDKGLKSGGFYSVIDKKEAKIVAQFTIDDYRAISEDLKLIFKEK